MICPPFGWRQQPESPAFRFRTGSTSLEATLAEKTFEPFSYNDNPQMLFDQHLAPVREVSREMAVSDLSGSAAKRSFISKNIWFSSVGLASKSSSS